MEVTSSNTVGVMVVPPSSAAQTWHTDDNPVLNTKGKKIFFAVFAGPCEEFRMGYIPREDDDSFPTHSVDARKKWMRYAPCSIGCHSTQAAHCGLQAPARALKTYRVYIEGLHRKGDEASARLLKSIAKSKSAKDGCMFRGGFEHWAGVSVATHASGAPFYIDQKGPLAPPSKGASAFWTPCLWYVSIACV